MMKTVILVFLLSVTLTSSAATKKKSTEESPPTPSPSELPDATTPGPAILAIEIVDSENNDTITEARNTTKRTIESALGYGFQSNYYPTSQQKKYMVYPYSQRDIPPSKDAGKYLNIQKSVSYNLGTKVEPTQKQLFSPTPTAVYSAPSGEGGYYPSTLYSTVGQGGIGGLSTHIPQQVPAATTIPVIILRVYTNQLADPSAIYPNLPQSHPYATNLNNINLQSIISNYLQQQMYQQAQQTYQTPSYQGQGQNVVYSTQNPTYVYSNQGGYQTAQQPQIDYKALEQAAASLPTHENYPADSHTRVIYHGPKGHIQGVSYSGGSANSQTYGVPQQQHQYTQYTQSQPTYSNSQAQSQPQPQPQPQSYSQNTQYQTDSPSPLYVSQSYPSNSQGSQSYASNSQESQSYPSNSQQVYTDSNGQSFIYVDPSQLQQGQGYYQQDYQQQEYQPQQEYQQQQQQYQPQQQQYQPQQEYQQEYQQVYQKPQEDRKYLPVPQASGEKVYNYHADGVKDRSKKSSGSPVSFESKKTETKRKA